MSKTDLMQNNDTENAVDNKESFDRDYYTALGLVGLFDENEGEALLENLNIKCGISVPLHDHFGIAPEWLNKHKDWNKKISVYTTPAEKAYAQASFDEIETIVNEYTVMQLSAIYRFKH